MSFGVSPAVCNLYLFAGGSFSLRSTWSPMQISESVPSMLKGVLYKLRLCGFLRYKHYERWATANDFPVENIVNNGSTTLQDQLGAVADLVLAIRSRKLQDDIMVVREPLQSMLFIIVLPQTITLVVE